MVKNTQNLLNDAEHADLLLRVAVANEARLEKINAPEDTKSLYRIFVEHYYDATDAITADDKANDEKLRKALGIDANLVDADKTDDIKAYFDAQIKGTDSTVHKFVMRVFSLISNVIPNPLIGLYASIFIYTLLLKAKIVETKNGVTSMVRFLIREVYNSKEDNAVVQTKVKKYLASGITSANANTLDLPAMKTNYIALKALKA